MKNLTPELIAKAKAAKSADELLELAKENNVELTEEEAKTYFAQLNANGAVSDDELDAVAGGGSCPSGEEENEVNTFSLIGKKVKVLSGEMCPKCHSDEGVVCYDSLAASAGTRSMKVVCPKCNEMITNYVNNENVKII